MEYKIKVLKDTPFDLAGTLLSLVEFRKRYNYLFSDFAHDTQVVKALKQNDLISVKVNIAQFFEVIEDRPQKIDTKLEIIPQIWCVYHEQFATDRYAGGTTLVKAESKQEAMDKLNVYLATKPHGVYTALPCTDIKYVWQANCLC